MLLHHAATTVLNVINLHCPCATERSQGMPLWKLLTTSVLFVRSYTRHNTPKGGQKVCGQGRSILDWSQTNEQLEQLSGSGSCHSEGPKNSPSGPTCFAFSKQVSNTGKAELRVAIIPLTWNPLNLACSFVIWGHPVPWAHATLDIL